MTSSATTNSELHGEVVRLLDLAQPPKVDFMSLGARVGGGWGGGAIPDEIESPGWGQGPVSSVLPYPPFQTSEACCHPSLCQDLTSALPTLPHTATGPADFKASN